ncbi:hypothetical protein GH714_040477 [Hevea brasiliensis]|uniref:Uncharacterized protein n=1 Tax=Hevea brasiliensis TaxID=3981 RepID=A0A6A6MGG6_HEVBR|nr:hypothetical protein GH714_040477 [Hevea brasiliensis]
MLKLLLGISVGIHRCILAARSRFFNELFKQEKGSLGKEGKPKYCLSDLLPYGKVGYEALLVFLNYLYTGKLKPSPMEVSTCVDNLCAHDACGPAINFAVELLYASSIFQVPELVSLFQVALWTEIVYSSCLCTNIVEGIESYSVLPKVPSFYHDDTKGYPTVKNKSLTSMVDPRRLVNFVDKAYVEDVIPILLVAYHCQLNQLVAQCVDRIARSDLDNISIEKELPYEVSENIKLFRKRPVSDDEENAEAVDPLHEKRIRRIHKALDSDDVELVKLLLTESDVTLDDANALHYAAAYCDPKVVSEVLGLDLANVNLKNSQGYTVLHIAAMRREPAVIVSLLAKGASALDSTLDGRSAVSICRRLTRPKDYDAKTEQGQEANKDRLCIDVLEREMRRNPMAGDASMTSQTMSDDLHMKLLYLENRVALHAFFPSEAKVAMHIANAKKTSEYPGPSASKGMTGNFREVDLNETPIIQKKRLLSRLEELNKTVEMGRRYFPNCSEVLDKFMEDDLPDLFFLEKGTPDEQRIKRMRFMELKEDVHRAFNKDKAEHSVFSSSSSSSSLKRGRL